MSHNVLDGLILQLESTLEMLKRVQTSRAEIGTILTAGNTLAAVERRHIEAALKASPSIVAAAKSLGISRRTLHRKLDEWKALEVVS